MKRCKNCKHFKEMEPIKGYVPYLTLTMRDAIAEAKKDGFGYCDNKMTDFIRAIPYPQMALGMSGFLTFHKDFGCQYHESSEG